MSDQIVNEITIIICQLKGISELPIDGGHLFRSGLLDSLDLVNLINQLEAKFGVLIDSDMIRSDYFASPLTISEMVRKLIEQEAK